MAQWIAQVLIGGTQLSAFRSPVAMAYLVQTARPAWLFVDGDPSSAAPGRKVIWVPSAEHPLEDVLILVAVQAMALGALRDLANQGGPAQKILQNRLDMERDLTPELHQQLRHIVQEIPETNAPHLSFVLWDKNLPDADCAWKERYAFPIRMLRENIHESV